MKILTIVTFGFALTASSTVFATEQLKTEVVKNSSVSSSNASGLVKSASHVSSSLVFESFVGIEKITPLSDADKNLTGAGSASVLHEIKLSRFVPKDPINGPLPTTQPVPTSKPSK